MMKTLVCGTAALFFVLPVIPALAQTGDDFGAGYFGYVAHPGFDDPASSDLNKPIDPAQLNELTPAAGPDAEDVVEDGALLENTPSSTDVGADPALYTP